MASNFARAEAGWRVPAVGREGAPGHGRLVLRTHCGRAVGPSVSSAVDPLRMAMRKHVLPLSSDEAALRGWRRTLR